MARKPQKSLTARQKQVITLAGQGYTIVDISNQLGIVPHTVQLHLCNAYKKLGLRGRMKKKRLSLSLIEMLERIERLEAAARTAGWDV